MIVFFFNYPATTAIYTLSLHDALPIFDYEFLSRKVQVPGGSIRNIVLNAAFLAAGNAARSEEHTSELQSHSDLVCRLLLEKKKTVLGPKTAVSLHTSTGARTSHRSPFR